MTPEASTDMQTQAEIDAFGVLAASRKLLDNPHP
jgi:hypothetical protein